MPSPGLVPRVTVSATQVETPLLTSTAGNVLTLLNWNEVPVRSLVVTVRLDHDVAGLVFVDHRTANLARTPKTSASWWMKGVVEQAQSREHPPPPPPPLMGQGCVARHNNHSIMMSSNRPSF